MAPTVDLRGRVVSGPEERTLFPAQELNLGNGRKPKVLATRPPGARG